MAHYCDGTSMARYNRPVEVIYSDEYLTAGFKPFDDYKQYKTDNSLMSAYINLSDEPNINGGYDLVCLGINKQYTIQDKHYAHMRTGISLNMPITLSAFVTPRSSIAKYGCDLSIVNSPGLVDPSYKGEIMIVLSSDNPELFDELIGKSVAQLVFIYNVFPAIKTVTNFSTKSLRQDKWFGSSGDTGNTGGNTNDKPHV